MDALEGVEIQGEVTEIGASAVRARPVAARSRRPDGARANTGNQAKDFKVTITLEDPPANLRPGLNATAEITTAKREKVLAVPIQAVVVREVDEKGKVVDPDAGPRRRTSATGNTVVAAGREEEDEEKEGVFVVEKEKTVFKPVKTGILGETDVEILEGRDRGTGDRHRLLQDPAHLRGRRPDQGREEEGRSREQRSRARRRPGPGRSSTPRTSGAPTRWAPRRSTPCAA